MVNVQHQQHERLLVLQLALDRVPAGIAGGDVFRTHGGQAVEPGLRAVQVGFGDGALRYASILNEVSHVEVGSAGAAYPTADALVELAHPRAIREEFVQPSELTPLYLRQADAEMAWRKRREGMGAPAGWTGSVGGRRNGGDGDGDGGVAVAEGGG